MLGGGRGAESEIPTVTMSKCAVLPGPHRLTAPGDAFTHAANSCRAPSRQLSSISGNPVTDMFLLLGTVLGWGKETDTKKMIVGRSKLCKGKFKFVL